MMSKWKSTAVGRSSAMDRVLPLRAGSDPRDAGPCQTSARDGTLLVLARLPARQEGGAGLARRAADHPRARLRHHAARVRDRPGQLPERRRPGRHRQRRLPGPLRRPGDARRWSASTRARPSRTSSRPRTSRRGRRSRTSSARAASSRPSSARVTALTFTNNMVVPRGEPERDADGNMVALGEIDPEGSPARQRRRRHPARRCGPRHRGRRGAQRVLARVTLTRITAIPRRGPGDRQPRVEHLPDLRQRGEHPEVAAARSSPTWSTPRWSCASRATRTSRPRARPPTFVEEATEALTFEGATVTTTGARDPAAGPQRLPHRRHDHARRHRRGDHGADPPGLLRRPVAAAAPRRDPRRPRVGVRPRRLPRHPAHHRHHRRPPGDARHRHRLRDPGPRPRRGGGRSSTAIPTPSRRRRATSARRCSSSPSTPCSPSSPCASPPCR